MKKLKDIAKEVIKEEQEKLAFEKVVDSFVNKVELLKQKMIKDGKFPKQSTGKF